MSQRRALEQIELFLSTPDPEVLSISGRWGVGKTFAWDGRLAAMRQSTPLRRYAYVSVFGLRSLDALKTAIVQSTVPLDGPELEPSVESFVEHISSFAGLRRLGEHAARKGLNVFGKGAAAVPYVGKLADLLAPGAALLIRDQIICIDDIERAGQGLEVADILGLVSSLRERRRCKIILLLNEDGLGEQGRKYRDYLEKVVDQAIKFEPTPEESASAAVDGQDALGAELVDRTIRLGIRNIRVIRRIRRFLGQIEPHMAGLHPGVAGRVVTSIALLGWCVFEPSLAPALEHVRRYARFGGLFTNEKRDIDELRTDQLLQGYGFGSFDDLDEVVLTGLQAGAFDRDALVATLAAIDRELAKDDVQQAVAKPWTILRGGLGDDVDDFVAAVAEAIETHGRAMTPIDASTALHFLRELDRADEAERLLPIYVEAQDGKTREFFAAFDNDRGRLDPAIAAAFDAKLANMPVTRDPAQILLEMSRTRSWNPNDVAYLATIPDGGFDRLLTELPDEDLHAAITMALDFGRMASTRPADAQVARRMAEALHRAAERSAINRLRLQTHLDTLPPVAAASETSRVSGQGGGSPNVIPS